MPSSSPVEFRTLLVEDQPNDAELVQAWLDQSVDPRFRLTFAKTMEHAEAALEHEDFDIILLDLDLPDSVGIETFEHLHALVPRTPIIVLTGFDDTLQAAAAMQRGARDYLPKHRLNGQALGRAIARVIERERLIGRLRSALNKPQQYA